MAGKPAPNKISNSNLKNNLSGVSESARIFGRYGNVFLTEAELSELQADFPTVWQEYIERLSEYMASTGKTYKSHAATIRRWAKEDRRNTTKTAEKWGVNVRFKLVKNDGYDGEVSVSGFGGAFE